MAFIKTGLSVDDDGNLVRQDPNAEPNDPSSPWGSGFSIAGQTNTVDEPWAGYSTRERTEAAQRTSAAAATGINNLDNQLPTTAMHKPDSRGF